MTLPLPVLDDRRFEDLFEEARALIPRFCPAWTDHNTHDPGITLVELFAWLVDTQSWRLDRIPARHRETFARLVGVLRREAEPATVVLWPARDEPPPGGFVPAETPVTLREHPELGFVTAEDVFLTGAKLARVATMRGPHADEHVEANRREGTRFLPFGSDPRPGVESLVLRVAPGFAEPRARLWFQLADDGLPPAPEAEPGAPRPEPTAVLRWQWRLPPGAWADLHVVHDATRGLSRSGAVTIEVPYSVRDAKDVPAALELRVAIERGGYEIAPELECVDLNVLPCAQRRRLPALELGIAHDDPDQELEIRHQGLEPRDLWLGASASAPLRVGDVIDRPGFLRRLPLPGRVESGSLLGFLAERVGSVRPSADGLTSAAAVAWSRLLGEIDTALASDDLLDLIRSGTPVRREILGEPPFGTPLPGTQELRRRARVAFEDFLESTLSLGGPTVVTVERGGPRRWRRVGDLEEQGPDSRCFVLDEERRAVRFGNGVNGRRPPAGCRVRLESAQTCAGARGNVGSGLGWTVAAPAAAGLWTNPWPAMGGRDPDTLEELADRARRAARERRRAVTEADVTALALAAPGARVARAFARFGRRPDLPGDADVPGCVTVVVVPHARPGGAPTPRPPTAALLRNVARHLRSRRLVGDEVFVAAPRYVTVSVRVRLHVESWADGERVRRAASATIDEYLAPLRYEGSIATGWEPGRDVSGAEILARLDDVEGVAFADGLVLEAPSRRAPVSEEASPRIVLGWRELAAPGTHEIRVRPVAVVRDARGGGGA